MQPPAPTNSTKPLSPAETLQEKRIAELQGNLQTANDRLVVLKGMRDEANDRLCTVVAELDAAKRREEGLTQDVRRLTAELERERRKKPAAPAQPTVPIVIDAMATDGAPNGEATAH